MQDIMKEYGPALITMVAIIAIVALIHTMFEDGGTAATQFDALITKFYTLAQKSGGLPTTP